LPLFLLGQEDLLSEDCWDNNQELINFCTTLEKVCVETVESGKMTKDLALCAHGENLTEKDYLDTESFLNAIDTNLKAKLS
jgi:isocitrate dehydrogenase